MPDESVRSFVLTDEHLTLVRAMYVGWQDCEAGAPEIDPKRPYGNSDVLGDMCELLDIEYDEDNGPDVATTERLHALHQETQAAVQIILRNGSILTGRYVAGRYDVDWRLDDSGGPDNG